MANIDREIKNMPEIIVKSSAESDIQRFYAGKTIFFTGCTGFLGKCLVEKLLRGCPEVRRIYLLVREKKGLSASDRMNEFFKDPLFDTLRSISIDFQSKIHLINGDLAQENVGISENDRNALIEEVNFIFHMASNIKFTERLSIALKINVLGTKAMLDLSKKCKHIEAFLYVSTAYSHSYHQNIMEEAYPSPADMKMVEDYIAADLSTPTGLPNDVLSNIIGELPNTYTFSKAIAEGLVDDAGKEVSFTCIVQRPAIVVSSWKEPVRGWCANLNGPGAIFLAYAMGVFHTVRVKDVQLDLIPVDMTVNATLVSVWDAVKKRPKVSGALVYNYGSSSEKPISACSVLYFSLRPEGRIVTPSIRAVWKDFIIVTNCFWYSLILEILFHYIPAVLYDTYLLIKRKKPRMLSTMLKISLNLKVFRYFIDRKWRLDISATNNAIERMSPIDRELFFCDIKQLDWKDFCSRYWDGARLYILKEPVTNIPAAQRRMRIIETVHYTIKYTVILLTGYVIARYSSLL